MCPIAVCALALAASATPADPLVEGFRNVPNDARLRMYWRVFGPAWTKDEIDYELEVVRKAGLGGVTVYFMYPFALDDPAHGIVNLRFGSPAFLETWAYAAQKANEKGLRFGLNGSTGWPYGGPTVKGKDAAQRLWHRSVPAGADLATEPKLKEGEAILAAYQGGREITEDLLAGTLALPSPMAAPIDLYLTGPTGMQVKRAAYGAEGPVLNHYSKPALMRYLKEVIEPMLRAAPGKVEALGCDSLEVYNSNWTDDLPREFRKRRGYDLIPHLPALFDEKSPECQGVKFDFWRTLAELTEERFTKPLGDWCAKRGLKLEMEAYGTPPNPMTAYRYIQVPTGEHYEWKGFSVQKYVSSAANQARKNIVGSEAWTWAGLPNRLADTLSDVKLVSDMAFVAGANDLTGVDFPYSPRSEGSPGWQPYYGPTFNWNNPQWAFFPALAGYLSRCQWMLRQGKPVRNVAVYLPVEDALATGPAEMMLLDFLVRDRFVTGKATSEFGLSNALKHQSDLLHGLISHGYDYDGIDFWSMNRQARVQGGKLVVGDGRYSAIVLPNLESMDLDAARKVHAFWQAGGHVVAVRRVPDRVPGLAHGENSAELRALMADMFGAKPQEGLYCCGGGYAVFAEEDSHAAALLEPLVLPDVVYDATQRTLGYVHRKSREADIYFLSNVGPETVRFEPRFRADTRHVELWDPLTGGIAVPDSSGPLQLELAPRGSIFVVLRRQTAGATREPRTVQFRTVELAPKWQVSFDGPDAPAPYETATLRSWTDRPGAKFFSGVATYTATFDWNDEVPKRALLRFDDVREAAEVLLNGKSTGVAVTQPWQFDVTGALKKGRNKLEVRVANLLVNRFIGLPDMDVKALRAKFGSRFQAPEEKELMKGIPAPSGLIGGVRLVLGRDAGG